MRLTLVGVALLFLVNFARAQTYELKNDVIDDGGTKISSSGYVLRGSFGQSTIGKISSANYIAYIGFWHPYPTGPGIEEDLLFRRSLPAVYSLSQNYPNPVAQVTTIKYGLPEETKVNVVVFNSAGQQIRSLVTENQEPGYYEVKWDLRGVSGQDLPNGVYFYRINAAGFMETGKMVILR